MPWYEREDFVRLLELADDRHDFHPDYDVWHANAAKVAVQYLARGQALQLISIKPGRFLEWLAMRGLRNTAATRLLYVEILAVRQLSPRDQPTEQRADQRIEAAEGSSSHVAADRPE